RITLAHASDYYPPGNGPANPATRTVAHPAKTGGIKSADVHKSLYATTLCGPTITPKEISLHVTLFKCLY
ncbi:hypothetical protein KI387_011881, partial [Taxus chinensis]